jgi:hypothetical protein
VLVAAAIGVGVAALATSPASAGTKQRRFVAWEDGKPTVRVTSRRNGDCYTASYVDVRPDTWRCFVGNLILDPCFEKPDEYGVVLCVSSPWERTGRIVFPDLSDSVGGGRGHPWALKTKSGRRCTFVSGASNVVNGRRLNYFCGRPKRPCPCLFGLPKRTRPTWTIFAGGVSGENWHRVPLAVSWR